MMLPESRSQSLGSTGHHEHRPEALLPAIWRFWKAYARRAAYYQSVLLLSFVYYAVLWPGAAVARLSGTQLLPPTVGSAQSYWRDRPPLDNTLDELKRQF